MPFRLMSRTMVLASPSASVATPLAVDAMPRTCVGCFNCFYGYNENDDNRN